MDTEKRLLFKLISALEYSGLSWFNILEDYLEIKLIKNEISNDDLTELMQLMFKFRRELRKDKQPKGDDVYLSKYQFDQLLESR